ncbi:MAG: hypothetical protein A3I75_00790 [Deltaproteobacteria bacterium RIFCSPLOWO2_02_FULL_50_16]|nr:MAG: hypothetical protein A2053_04610 [Deltaproteobacteria bacterium GWA2_50_8]OGQ30514.1 MAG: hypothetical protein A3B79_02540 [Deltaproteobacteria bacterium RIFCSPHIGHO2_02_FULL_50_15]OGQ56364.1 MAG: hypothetical protein A3I75_00790 [Deltaproteobacteria bacterium RIFCSPLOWO2_02_FULL_50_16]OGQ67767.1 MAG: hypothetical protein A3F89_02035 [Deltaproteobacteria bacterium RIFCSPLOWO2_12_FULL_50_11]
MRLLFHVLKKYLPWLIAIVIFHQLFTQYPPAQIWEACKQANLIGLMIFMFFYFMLVLWLDCWGHARVFTRFHAPMGTLELVPVRLASYVIMLINYGAGQGVWAYFLKKKKSIPFFKAMGILGFVIVLDFYLITSMAFLGSLLAPLQIENVSLNQWVQLLMLIATIFIITIYLLRKKILKIIPNRWEKLHDLFLTLKEARIKDLVATLLLRLPLHLTFIVAIYSGIHFFHAHIPLTSLIASIPLIYLIGSMPITPGGLGTTQAAFVILLKNDLISPAVTAGVISPEEILLSMSLLWAFSNYLYKASFGFVFFKKYLSPSRQIPETLA